MSSPHCFSLLLLSMVTMCLFWMCLFVPVTCCQQFWCSIVSHLCESLGMYSLYFVSWSECNPVELHINVLGCANLGVVNTYHSYSPFIWLFFWCFMLMFPFSFHLCRLQGLLWFSVPELILLIAEIFSSKRVFLNGCRHGFLKGEELNLVLLHAAGAPQLPEMHHCINLYTFECRFNIE